MWEIEKTVSKGDYVYAIVRNHPKRTKNDYVLLHRVVVENILQRELREDEVVHHVNHDTRDNRPENLKVMTRSEHAKHHASLPGQKWVDLICPECGKEFDRPHNKTFLAKPKNSYTACSRSCSGKLAAKLRSPDFALGKNVLRQYKRYMRQ